MQTNRWPNRIVEIYYNGNKIGTISRLDTYESYILELDQDNLNRALESGLDPMYIDGKLWLERKKFPKIIRYHGPWYPDFLLYRTPEYLRTHIDIMEEYNINFDRVDKLEYDRLDFLVKYYAGRKDKTGLEFKEAVKS